MTKIGFWMLVGTRNWMSKGVRKSVDNRRGGDAGGKLVILWRTKCELKEGLHHCNALPFRPRSNRSRFLVIFEGFFCILSMTQTSKRRSEIDADAHVVGHQMSKVAEYFQSVD